MWPLSCPRSEIEPGQGIQLAIHMARSGLLENITASRETLPEKFPQKDRNPSYNVSYASCIANIT